MNVLIIGGGLSGILVSAALRQQDVPHDLVTSPSAYTGSLASSGILNPVMGQKRQLVADYGLLSAACTDAYGFLNHLLKKPFFQPVQITEVISGNKGLSVFKEKALLYPDFLQTAPFPEASAPYFHIPEDALLGLTQHAFVLQTAALQERYLALLEKEGRLIRACFPATDAPVEEANFSFKGKKYTHLIYCNGKEFPETEGAQAFSLSVNKGQALVLNIEAPLPRNRVFKLEKNLTLCPWGEDLWWAGASFEWAYTTENPDAAFLEAFTKRLQQVLKAKFRVVKALTGFRVSTKDRRAIAGWLPQNRRIGFLNGLGTKGVLQAPRAALELVGQLMNQPLEKSLFSPSRFIPVKDMG